MMATMNGITSHGEHTITPAPHLGKRKRAGSPDLKEEIEGNADSSDIQQELDRALQLMRKHDTTGSIIKHALPSKETSHPAKRLRKSSTPPDNIESRILNRKYTSFDELISDVEHMKDELEEDNKMNGHVNGVELTGKQVDAISQLLSRMRNKTKDNIANGTSTETVSPRQSSSRVLSLRSQTENGTKQLFSGLPQPDSTALKDMDVKKLPNGFEFSTVAMLDRPKVVKEKRLFGDVFAPSSKVKSLEAPRPDRRHRDLTTLSFVPTNTNIPAASKFDYKYAALNTGSWLQYATSGDNPSIDGKQKSNTNKSVALFKAAFSSFAPTTDHSSAVVTESDRSRQWWKQYSSKHTILDLPETQTDNPEPEQEIDFVPGEDFEDLILNFVSEADLDDRDEGEKLLDEVSELLETLSSYQTIRDSEHARGPSSANKPTKPEIDVYNMLKSQLQILVSSLPPYAVAKLNGDQLEALNISTHLLITPPEFSGTSQADENTLRKIKAATSAANTANRTAVPSRNTYNTPTAAYNAQAPAYNRNVPATTYAPRQNPAMYSTPRTNSTGQAAPYSQPNYRPGTGTYANATIQQYQRAQGLAPGTVVPPYLQRPSQPGYQQRAQDNGTAFTRSDSPQQPNLNGQPTQSQQARQYATQLAQYAAQQTQSPGIQSQPTGQYRQTSGTPQPQDTIIAAQQSVAGTIS